MAHRGRKGADEALLLALACGATVEAAAQSVGLSRRTAQRRLGDAAFRQKLQGLRADMVQRTAGMLTAASMEAVKTLLALQKESIPAAVRLGAARSVLELGMKVRETAELEQRLRALEERLAGSPSSN